MESKLDRVRAAWDNCSNDKDKRRSCKELKEVIKSLEVELKSKNKNIEKLNKKGKNLVGNLIVSIIIGISGWWGLYITYN